MLSGLPSGIPDLYVATQEGDGNASGCGPPVQTQNSCSWSTCSVVISVTILDILDIPVTKNWLKFESTEQSSYSNTLLWIQSLVECFKNK